MTAESKELYEFKKQVQALKKFQGHGTELISVYISPGYPVPEITAKLRDEFGQASNIKSATTKKNVQGALERIMHFLKGVNKPPENGIAVFCGNLSETEGRVDIQIYSVVPPMPLTTQFYRCESQFVLEPLEDLLEHTDTYGLVVMDGKEATVAILKGKQLKVVKKLESTAHQKVNKGGQSAARYDRLHIEGVEFYYSRVGEAMNAFVGLKNFKGVIIGGPGPSKEDFAKQKPFNYQLKVLGVVDTGYTDEYGLREILEKSGEIIAEQEAIVEKKLFDEFTRELANNGLVAYGLEACEKAVESKQASKLLISEEMELKKVKYKCSACGKELERLEERAADDTTGIPCECGGHYKIVEMQDVVNDLVGKAEEQGIPVVMISKDTAEGKQFYGTFKGLGVFLRYKL